MQLRYKFPLLLAALLLLTVMVITIVQSRFFISDQISYISDFQTARALFIERELRIRLKSQGGETVAEALRDHPEWLEGAINSLYGSEVRFFDAKGILVAHHRQTKGVIRGPEYFENSKVFSTMVDFPGNSPRTVPYRSVSGADFLGTFLKVSRDPPVLLVLSTPASVLDAVIRRTYRQSAWVGIGSVLVAVISGIWFSIHLSSPLSALVHQSIQVASGHFERSFVVPAARADEVGILARSFNRMITELGRTRDELRKTERLAALGKFSSAIAHEIKNPLSSILGNTQVAKRKIAQLPQDQTAGIRQALDYVEEETLRSNRIVQRLLTFARQDKRPDQILNLTERVRRSVAMIRPLVEQTGAILVDEICERGLMVCANGDQIHEVLLNLIQNGVHAVRKAPLKRISVALTSFEGKAFLRISDTGEGIPKENLGHIFEPFFTTKEIGQGTGLGLAVCHGIVMNHRGEITVHSEIGAGTRFEIVLSLSSEFKV